MEGIKITKETIKSNKTTELKKEDRASETNTLKMANVLNDFFVNIVKQMGDDSISSRPFNERKLHEFVSSKIENLVTQYNIPPITVQEVVKLIDRLSCSKATGPDAIPV